MNTREQTWSLVKAELDTTTDEVYDIAARLGISHHYIYELAEERNYRLNRRKIQIDQINAENRWQQIRVLLDDLTLSQRQVAKAAKMSQCRLKQIARANGYDMHQRGATIHRIGCEQRSARLSELREEAARVLRVAEYRRKLICGDWGEL